MYLTPLNETSRHLMDYSIPTRMKYDTGKTMIVGQISSRRVSEMWKVKSYIQWDLIKLYRLLLRTHNTEFISYTDSFHYRNISGLKNLKKLQYYKTKLICFTNVKLKGAGTNPIFIIFRLLLRLFSLEVLLLDTYIGTNLYYCKYKCKWMMEVLKKLYLYHFKPF